MTKYIIGEFFSSGGATLYKNPSDQTVICKCYNFMIFFLNSFFLGKKKLHRGQLLPGSTSEDDESKKKPPTCWSECSSPRKQVRLDKKYNKCYNFTEKNTHFFIF